ncbi:uncharacterized transmembrane protein DDB_G0289901 isoform X2 [Nematostella vectensis]|nr:uncharacterized transmembrane protein DDB_G0289901 isoform X2 [Nematostella vectensis]XP_048589313.1 uncharacterized transmembrane protein DDB_G0289901 isoform X2 [Nematostella vectensis]
MLTIFTLAVLIHHLPQHAWAVNHPYYELASYLNDEVYGDGDTSWMKVGDCGQGLTCGPDCQLLCLKMHNYYRALHKVPPVKCDNTIAKSAQEWTDEQARQGNSKHLEPEELDKKKVTESISWKGWGWEGMETMEGAIPGAVRGWYSEIKNDYNYQTGKGNGKAVGHFQAVVWKSIEKIGCGLNIKKDDGTYVTTHYQPSPHQSFELEKITPANVLPRKDPEPACDLRSTERELCNNDLKAPFVTPEECVKASCCYDDMFMSEKSLKFYDAEGRKWCFARKGGSPAPTSAPGANKTTAAGGTTAAPGGTTVAPGGTTAAPGGTTAAQGGTTVAPGGTTAAPGGTTAAPGGTTAAPGGTTAAPGGTTTAPGGTTAAPGGTTAAPGGTTAAPGGTTAAPGGTTAAPGGTTTAPEGTTAAPAATTESPTASPSGNGTSSSGGFTGDSCYSLVTKGESWAEGRKTCQSKGGDLVSIETDGEWSYVKSLVELAANGYGNEWHVGLEKASSVWKWTSGANLGNAQWASSSGGSGTHGSISQRAGLQMKGDGTTKMGVVCEKKQDGKCTPASSA